MRGERVVITGMGIISCLGNTLERVTESLRDGRSGIVLLPERKKLGFNSCLSGTVKDFQPTNYLSRKQRKTLPEFGLWAWAAIEQALAQSGTEPETLCQDEMTGIIFGNDSSTETPVEQVEILKKEGNTRSIAVVTYSGLFLPQLHSTSPPCLAYEACHGP